MNSKSPINNITDPEKPVGNISPGLKTNASIIVVGAGAFGGWTSLWLLRKGFKVTNIDMLGAGNSESSSGGETRLLRYVYGLGSIYTRLAARAYHLWLENEKKFEQQVFFPTGALWFVREDRNFSPVASSLGQLDTLGLKYERMTPAEATKRYPLLNTSDLSALVLEEQAGYLMAREACNNVIKTFVAEGGNYIQGRVKPGSVKNNKLTGLSLPGKHLEAEAYVFACGPWNYKIFPGILDNKMSISRQEVFYFGTPSHMAEHFENQLPPWLDLDGEDMYYGFPPIQRRGFKIAAHGQGTTFDPDVEDRIISGNELEKARNYLSFRFPLLKKAPLVESRVCQYSNTPDEHFILDLHPGAGNTWILGGGSGHGFKHGPAMGELAAAAIIGESAVPKGFLLSRFRD